MLERRVEISKTLRATSIVLGVLVDGINEAGLRRRPGMGEWAIIEVVGQHLAVLESLDAADGERPGRHGEHGQLMVEL